MAKRSKEKPSINSEVTVGVPAAAPRKPLVFISHDTRDAVIAEAFAILLQDASGGFLDAFRSSDRSGTSGIEFGADWYTTIMSRLKDATDVVALLTPNSLERPWLLYEAGVAKGRLDTVVFGVALCVPLDRANIGPFAQFQNSGDDEDSLTKLVLQLIRRNPGANPRDEAVRRQVSAFTASLPKVLTTSSATKAKILDALDTNAVARLFEEVKVMFQQLPDRLEKSLERRLASPFGHSTSPEFTELFEQLPTLKHLHDRLQGELPGTHKLEWVLLSIHASQIDPTLYERVTALSTAWEVGDIALFYDILRAVHLRLGQLARIDEPRRTPRDLKRLAQFSLVMKSLTRTFREQFPPHRSETELPKKTPVNAEEDLGDLTDERSEGRE